MSLYKEWENGIKSIKTQEDYNDFWDVYLTKETGCYKAVLASKNPVVEGVLKDLAQKNDMTPKQFVGFLDGANTSFIEPLDLEILSEETEVKAEFDFEKLLFNMHDAKAEWLYGLEEWNEIFNKEKQIEIEKNYKKSKTVVKADKIGRNDPCSCGSGKKYKKCCGK
jgi:hypothetical protein